MKGKIETLWQFTLGHRRLYLAAILALGMGTLLLYVSPLAIGAVISGVLENNPNLPAPSRFALWVMGGREFLGTHLWIAAAVVGAFTALGGAFMYLKSRWCALASERIIRALRDRLYSHLQHLPSSYHDGAQTGDLVQRCTSDVETVRNFYSNQIVEIARASTLLLIALPLMFMLDWLMALVAIALLPIIITFAVIFFRRIQKSFLAMDESEGALTTVLQENLTGIRVVRAFARQHFEHEKFARRNAHYRDLHYYLHKVLAVYWASSDFLCFMQISSVLLVGAARVSAGSMAVGTLVQFLLFVGIYIWPVRQMGRILSEMGKAMVSLTRIQEVLNSPPETKPDSPAPVPARVRGLIEFQNLSFAHRGTAVLSDVTFRIEPGQTVALLGPSGAGKSTIINLLLRFYDYASGSIRIDGIELSTMDRKAIRSQFGVVMQEPFLYSKTLRDNIRLGRFAATDDEVIEAASVAHVHESIARFDKKYDTLVGERGVTLSGGQRQRVAIARALLKDAPILVLDDALSAVDTHTETVILDALKSRRGRHTTILIAHRLSTLMHADTIIVLDRGRIVQSGPHDRLVEEPGLYRNLWSIQTALEEDLRAELGDNSVAAVPASMKAPD